MKQVTVIARARAKHGKEQEVEAALKEIVDPTHAESGCLKYIIHRSVEVPTQFVVVERWTSQEDLQTHLRSSHIQDFFKKLPPLLETTPEVSVFESIDPGKNPKGCW